MHLRPDPSTVRIVPWAADPTAQVIHDCFDTRRQAGALRAALGAAPRLRPVRRRGLGPGGGARAGVLPGRAQHRPRHAAEAADRPQRPRRDLAPGLLDRRGQRVRPAVRGRLRLLREDGAERRHADPRGRRRPDGDQLLPRPPAGPGRRGVLLQAHGARGGAAPRHVRHLHGQADRRRAGQRDARAPERGRQGHRPQHLQQRGRQRRRKEFYWYIGGLQKYMPAAMALFAPYVNSYRRLVRFERRADQHPVGHRQPHRRHPQPGGRRRRRGASRTASSAPTPTPTSRWPPRWPAATWASRTASSRRPNARATPTWATSSCRAAWARRWRCCATRRTWPRCWARPSSPSTPRSRRSSTPSS